MLDLTLLLAAALDASVPTVTLLDAAAAAAIRQSLLDLAGKGAAIIVISQDLDELMEISTRFSALNNGKLSVAQPMAKFSLDEIGLLLGGADA